MKKINKTIKPRNPIVPAMIMRQSGAHVKSQKAERGRDKVNLKCSII